MKLSIPFYSSFATPGHPEGVHCAEICLKMILGYFEPNTEYSIEDLENITGKKPEMGSWSFDWSIWFARNGYLVRNYSTFDYELFKERGIDYIRQVYGKEIADWQEANTDVEQARARVDEYLCLVEVVTKKPTLTDVKKEHESGAVVKAKVNSRILNNREGYEGHGVVVLDADDRYIWFHDPGLPAHEDRRVSLQLFQKAMDSFGGEMDAVKRASN